MIEDIEKIIKIFEASNVSKMSLEYESMKLQLEKNDTVDATDKIKEITNNDIIEDKALYITSPVVGTFYTTRGPGKPPFVTVGSKVKKGDILCIIEAMKVMNEVTSPYDGVIKEIITNNEDLVEFGQNLFKIGETND